VIALALESALLVRHRGNFLKHYRFFYLYLAGSWFQTCRSFLLYLLPKTYGYAYGVASIFSLFVGCCVVLGSIQGSAARYRRSPHGTQSCFSPVHFGNHKDFRESMNSPNWIPGKTTLETNGISASCR